MKRTTRAEYQRRFAGLTFTKGLDPQELEHLGRLCTGYDVPAGTTLIDERNYGKECFLIAEGQASVYVDGVHVASLGPGELVGEVAMFDHGTRTASVVADTPLHTHVMARQEFHTAAGDIPVFGRMVACSLARRLRAADELLAQRVA